MTSNRKALQTADNKFRLNAKFARSTWEGLSNQAIRNLRNISEELGLLIEAGHLQLLGGHWYVTHAGLLRVAARHRCQGIRTILQQEQSDPQRNRWVFRATVYKSRSSRGFVGYGDADPSNVSPLLRGAEMRIAETRAVNRALRKAYGIGLCSVEELGWLSGSPKPTSLPSQSNGHCASNGSQNGQLRLRDRLCLLIRQYNLDPNLVKVYAAQFCGARSLREASRESIESFIAHLAASAKEDLDGLLCKLNSFAPPSEVKP
jgi:hypothetical protein